MKQSCDLVNHQKGSQYRTDARNEKSMSTIRNWPSLSLLTLQSEFLWQLEFFRNLKDLYGKYCWWADLPYQQHFPYKSLQFFQNSNSNKHSLSLMPGVSNLAILLLSTCSFHFCHPFCVTNVFYGWQGHVTGSCKEPIPLFSICLVLTVTHF